MKTLVYSLSATRFLIDTNTLSDAIKRPQGRVAKAMVHAGTPALCTSIIVACELRYGASKKASARLSAKVEALLDSLSILPLEPGLDSHYATLRCHLEQRGTPIGANDLFIAAHALALDLTLVTGNIKEFSRVPDLRLENWLET